MTPSWFKDYRAALLACLSGNATLHAGTKIAVKAANILKEKRAQIEPERKGGSNRLPTPEEIASQYVPGGADDTTVEWPNSRTYWYLVDAIKMDRLRRA